MSGSSRSFLYRFLVSVLAVLFIHVSCKTRSKELLAHGEGKALLKECDDVKVLTKTVANFFLSIPFQKAIIQIKEKAQDDPTNEHIISFGRDSLNMVIFSPLYTGSRSSGRVPEIANAFADLHNHPNNTPPSSGDLYGLLRNNIRDRQYSMRFILTPTGALYAFAVKDTAAARGFLIGYPPQQTPGYSPLFPDALLDEYREIQQRYGASEEMAMAYMLEKYNVGVVLLKQLSNGTFKTLKTGLSVKRGEKVFTLVDCPEQEL